MSHDRAIIAASLALEDTQAHRRISKAKITGAIAGALEEHIEQRAGIELASVELRVAFLGRGSLRLAAQVRRAGDVNIVALDQLVGEEAVVAGGIPIVYAHADELGRRLAAHLLAPGSR